MVKRMIQSSREEIRKLFAAQPSLTIIHGMQIGKSHTLVLREGVTTSVKRQGLQLIVTLAPGDDAAQPNVIESVRSHMRAILRKEAKAHLPKRIAHLATVHGFTFSTLRFTHASSRWGSCNSNQAISLNIALMNLPFELIDYVLLHELAHTKHLNHSKSFWNEVARTDAEFAAHRSQLKRYNPAI